MTSLFVSTRRTLKFLAVLALMPAIAGCGPVIGIGNQTPATIYQLQPLQEELPDALAPGRRLVVEGPTATGGLDTNRMAVKTGPLELKYLAEARWSQRLPLMVQTLLIDSLETGADILSLTYDAGARLAPYTLATEIRDFQADVTQPDAPEITIRMALQLMDQAPRALIGNTTVTATATASANTAPALAEAFNEAMQDILRQTVTWTVSNLPAES